MIVRSNIPDVVKTLNKVTDNLPKQLGIATGKATRRGRSIIAKDVTKTIAVKQKTVRQYVKFRKSGKVRHELTLKKSSRIPLRDFGARQTKRGVTYKINKQSGRQTAVGAFMGPKPGVQFTKFKGRVFRRTGKQRLPITQLMGISPWGYVVKGRRIDPIGKQLKQELIKQAYERVRYLKLKKSGAI